MNWDWMPGVRCGPFVFDQALPDLVDATLTLLEPACDGADWRSYRVGHEEARVRVQDGVLTAVECVKSLRYLDRDELLGLPIDEVEAIIGEALVRAKHWDDGSAMYEAKRLGLTLWVEDGRVESGTVEA
jgi:hypothetical protein